MLITDRKTQPSDCNNSIYSPASLRCNTRPAHSNRETSMGGLLIAELAGSEKHPTSLFGAELRLLNLTECLAVFDRPIKRSRVVSLQALHAILIRRRVCSESYSHVVLHLGNESQQDFAALVRAFPEVRFGLLPSLRETKAFELTNAGHHTHLPDLYNLDKFQRPDLGAGSTASWRLGILGEAVNEFDLATLSATGYALSLRTGLPAQCSLLIRGGQPEKISCGRVDILSYQSELDWPWLIKEFNLLLPPTGRLSGGVPNALAAACGVPSVLETRCPWAPSDWCIDVRSSTDIINTALRVLADPDAPRNGWNGLLSHNRFALDKWWRFLSSSSR